MSWSSEAFYWGMSDGGVVLFGEHQYKIFTLLLKLGLKKPPAMSVWSYATNSTFVTSVNGISSTSIIIDNSLVWCNNPTSSVDKPKKTKKRHNMATKEERREWRTTQTKHSRNTASIVRQGGRR